MSAKITIAVSNYRTIHLNVLHSQADIDRVIADVRQQLPDLLDSVDAQADFNKRYMLSNDDIVQEFNGDYLYMAMCIRDVFNEDLTDDMQLQEDIQSIGDGLIKPSRQLLSEFSRMLKFPEGFFLREGKVNRTGEGMFFCKTPEWAGDSYDAPPPRKFPIDKMKAESA